jgi:hypothetical protein
MDDDTISRFEDLERRVGTLEVLALAADKTTPARGRVETIAHDDPAGARIGLT